MTVLSLDPTAGVVIPGAGGLQASVRRTGKGKRGGYRVITFFSGADMPVFLLNVFAQGDKVDLTAAELNELRKELAGLADTTEVEQVAMSKAGERLLRSVRRARAYARGEAAEGFVAHVPDQMDVKALRTKLGLSQEALASVRVQPGRGPGLGTAPAPA